MENQQNNCSIGNSIETVKYIAGIHLNKQS